MFFLIEEKLIVNCRCFGFFALESEGVSPVSSLMIELDLQGTAH